MWPPSDWSIRTSSCTPFSKSFTTMILSAKMASRYLQQMMRHTHYLNDDKKVIPVSQNHGEDSYGNSWKPCCKVNIKNHSRNQFSSLIFQSWEKNDDPAEQEGKGVAIKSCTQFFTWLKEVRHPSNSSDVPFSIISSSGGGGGGRLVGCGCCGDICKKSFAPRRIEIQTVALS